MYCLQAANNYGATLISLQRYKEAKSLLRKTIPIARRVLGEGNQLSLGMRLNYAARVLCHDGATLENLREAMTTLEEMEPTARRVLGSAHPFVANIEVALRQVRAALRARETLSPR